jgi:predicted regulator of Ras-like GTPase activity (Roadblock/LC7/MglB family)
MISALSERVVALLAQRLETLQQETTGVLSLVLASADGLTVASTLRVREEADRLSAMSGSLAGLTAALVHETGHGAPERLIVESSKGYITTLQVPMAAGGDLVLTVVASKQAVLGKLLWSCRQTANQMSEDIQQG